MLNAWCVVRCRGLPGLLTCVVVASAPVHAQPGTARLEHTAQPQPKATALFAPSSPDAELVTRTLTARGFANVATIVEGQRVFVTFENTRYRDLRRGLREVAALLRGGPGVSGELVLVPSVDGLPLGTAAYPAAGASTAPAEPDTVTSAVPGPRTSLSLSGIPGKLLASPQASSSFGRVDVVVHPWFEASFGDYAEPVRSRTGVAPEIRIALRRGLRLSAQVLFTLQDDLPTGESRVRPGLVTLTQTMRLPRDVFVHATAGAFTPNRYGADVQARAYTPSGRWFAGAELGQTGLTSFARDDWQLLRMESRTALVEAGWRDLRHGLTVQATAGAFLSDQQGIRLDVVRQFGEVDFGGFVMTSEEGKNGGAMLRIPLGVTRHLRPAAIRLRAADAFRWEYRYYGGVPGGRRFRAGQYMDDSVRWSVTEHVNATR